MTVRFPSFAFAAKAPDIFKAPTEAVGMLGDIQKPALMRAQIQEALAKIPSERFKAQHPLMGMGGAAGQVGAMLYLAQHPELQGELNPSSPGQVKPSTPNEIQQTAPDVNLATPTMAGQSSPSFGQATGRGLPSTGNALVDRIRDSMNSASNMQRARAGYYDKMVQAYNYRTMPPDYKSALLAQAAGMGYTPFESQQLFMNGRTIKDLANTKGFDPNHMPDPVNVLTTQGRTENMRRNQAISEINALSPILSSALAPFARTVHGYSIKQIARAIGNADPDKQARFLAARAVQPEMAALRYAAARGSRMSIQAIKELMDKSMANFNVFQGLVSPEIYNKTNNYIEQWLNTSVEAANKYARVIKPPGQPAIGVSPPTAPTPAAPTIPPTAAAVPSQMVKVISPEGRVGNIPAARLSEALKGGFRRAR